jgi:tetratricopeptide (TPR) repeat protein
VRRIVLPILLVVAGCGVAKVLLRSANPALVAAAERGDALALSDTLEQLISDGQDRGTDRKLAYEAVKRHQEDTAAYAFARASITGRFVQQRGFRAVGLLAEVEDFALRSRELDPDFRDGAADRLLGTLYAMAPSKFLKHGDSELGLELLEDLVEKRPDIAQNHLRLAEAYLALGDPDPARPHLCTCLEMRSRLRRDESALLDRLIADAGVLDCAKK